MPEIILMKYGLKAHMKSFVDNGQLCMNSMNYFHEIEGDALRYDPHEGLVSIKQMKDGILRKINPETGKNEKIATITKATIRETSFNVQYLNLFCMFALNIERLSSLNLAEYVDRRVWRNFGDSLVIILNADKFLSRIKIAAERERVYVKFGLVQYEDFKVYEGNVGPFVKNQNYSYQKEARLVAINRKPERLFLNVGPINDIAMLLNASDTPKLSISETNA